MVEADLSKVQRQYLLTVVIDDPLKITILSFHTTGL